MGVTWTAGVGQVRARGSTSVDTPKGAELECTLTHRSRCTSMTTTAVTTELVAPLCALAFSALRRPRPPAASDDHVCGDAPNTCALHTLDGRLYICLRSMAPHLCDGTRCPRIEDHDAGRDVCAITGTLYSTVRSTAPTHLFRTEDEDARQAYTAVRRARARHGRAKTALDALYDAAARCTTTLHATTVAPPAAPPCSADRPAGGGGEGRRRGGTDTRARRAQGMLDLSAARNADKLDAVMYERFGRLAEMTPERRAAWSEARDADERAVVWEKASNRVYTLVRQACCYATAVRVDHEVAHVSRGLARVDARAARRARVGPRQLAIMEAVVRARIDILWTVCTSGRTRFLLQRRLEDLLRTSPDMRSRQPPRVSAALHQALCTVLGDAVRGVDLGTTTSAAVTRAADLMGSKVAGGDAFERDDEAAYTDALRGCILCLVSQLPQDVARALDPYISPVTFSHEPFMLWVQRRSGRGIPHGDREVVLAPVPDLDVVLPDERDDARLYREGILDRSEAHVLNRSSAPMEGWLVERHQKGQLAHPLLTDCLSDLEDYVPRLVAAGYPAPGDLPASLLKTRE